MKTRYGILLSALAVLAPLILTAPPGARPADGGASSQGGGQSPLPGARSERLRVEVDLVLVNVTVTDPYNRLVTGLQKDHFELFEDDNRQEILYFSSEDAPLSLGLVFDVSDSMNSSQKLPRAVKAAVQFLQTANPQDEFILVQFSDTPRLITEQFTSDVEAVQHRLLLTRGEGRTALLDALYLTLAKMREANNPRKALLVISDGGDNRSRYGVKDIKAAVRESDVQIYAIGIFDPVGMRDQTELLWGPSLLGEIAEMTGGRMFPVEVYNIHDLPDIATKISIELRNQYVIGYRPSNRERDGSWREIKVKIDAPKGLPPLTTYARSGYYAPSQ